MSFPKCSPVLILLSPLLIYSTRPGRHHLPSVLPEMFPSVTPSVPALDLQHEVGKAAPTQCRSRNVPQCYPSVPALDKTQDVRKTIKAPTEPQGYTQCRTRNVPQHNVRKASPVRLPNVVPGMYPSDTPSSQLLTQCARSGRHHL